MTWEFVNLEYAIGVSFVLLFLLLLLFQITVIVNGKRKKRFNRLKEKYPIAYKIFMNEMNREISEDLDDSTISKLLSNKEEVWRRKEEEELKKQQLANYNVLKRKYPDGISCLKKESSNVNIAETLLRQSDIIRYDRNQKKYLADREWMNRQEEFNARCKRLHSFMPHAGYFVSLFNVSSVDYKGNKIFNKYKIWHFFFAKYCAEPDLDYTNHKDARENFLHLNEYKGGKYKIPAYVTEEINSFINANGDPCLILCNKDLCTNEAMSTLSLHIDSHRLHRVDYTPLPSEISSDYIIVIDRVTSNTDFENRCIKIIDKYASYCPCIVYISLMKEYSLAQMQRSIERKQQKIEAKRKEEEEKRKAEELIRQKQIEEENKRNQIVSGIQHISDAINTANIEEAQDKIDYLKKGPAFQHMDDELVELLQNEENRLERSYETGIADPFEIQHVDYHIPASVQDSFNWNYPVVKYPKYDNIVFPYRRRRIARRGYSEANFQTYVSSAFNDSNLLILGDVNILPNDDSRPYEPDIAIISKEHPSIRIDVEIDEPYAAISRRPPIHYIGCGDDFRDIKLNNLGWIVIRFTEYQVYTDPKACAGFIAKVLKAISPSLNVPNTLVNYPFPEPVIRWTEIEAKLMASEKKRENYLDHEFGRVNNENLTVSDIKQTERERNCASLVKPIVIQEKTESPLLKSDYPNLLIDRDSDIQFFAFEHIYLYKGKSQFIPVSSVISYFFEPFNSDYWSGYKADRRHVPQGQVLEEWDCKGAKSREVGTFMHKQIENYYNGLEYELLYHFKYSGEYIKIEENVEIDTEKGQFDEFVQDHPFKPFRTEWTIYDEDLGIAGTIDMIH